MQDAKGKMQKRSNFILHFEFRILHYTGATRVAHGVARS
jgi:hypothetical protein